MTYLVADTASGEATIIDPVLDFDRDAARTSTTHIDEVLSFAAEKGWTVKLVLETHAHADHLSAADYVRQKTGAKIAIGTAITQVQQAFASLFDADDIAANGDVFDILLHDGDSLNKGVLTLTAMHTPGHTPACMTYLIGAYAFVGDTIFMPDFGTARCDFPGGDARTLYRSIRRILDLPPHTQIMVGHDYPPNGRAAAWQTSVQDQRANNIHIQDGISEDAFVAMREKRDAGLAVPKLILPSLQVNIRAGAMPPAHDNGTVYLTLPVNRLGG